MVTPFTRSYDITEHFAKRFDTTGRQMAFKGKTHKEAIAWQKKFHAKLSQLLGMNTFERTKPRAKRHGREDMGSYWREDWTLHTEPDVIAPFYVLVPKDIRKGNRRPAVICPHGHASGGRSSPAGRTDIPIVAQQIAAYNYDYAVQLVHLGFVTFAMDARGFGQRRIQVNVQNGQWEPASFINSSCHQLLIMSYPFGQTISGMWTWDLMRLIDHIQTRTEIDPHRIGCAGLSGGGNQALYLAALDSRVNASVISGYFYGVKDSLIRIASNCFCNCVPNLWSYADMGDIGGLIAPRGLLIETGTEDSLNGKSGVSNVTTQVAYTRKVYKAMGCAGQLAHHVFILAGHTWCGNQALPWMEKHSFLCNEKRLVLNGTQLTESCGAMELMEIFQPTRSKQLALMLGQFIKVVIAQISSQSSLILVPFESVLSKDTVLCGGRSWRTSRQASWAK